MWLPTCTSTTALVATFGTLASAQSIPVTTIVPSQQDLALAAHLEEYYSYGRSPPVLPAPPMSGAGDWMDSYERAKTLLTQMTNDEKNNITYCHNSATNGCSAMSGGVPRLGFPGLCLQDNGNSIRDTDGVNGYPSALHIGASWNKDLALESYTHLGAEFKRKGANVALGPVAGVLGKIATGGRNWEGFSNDPYLSGTLTHQSVIGLQKSVIAAVKHFVGNEQETSRYSPRTFTKGALNQSISSNIDDKTMHEVYMWPFQDAVHAGAGGIMCSYNQLNGSYGCQNSKALNGLVKGELGFQGFIMSDWEAQHSGLASANNGLDLTMPESPYWKDGNLSLSVTNGSLSQERLDDMALRIITSYLKFAEFEPGTGMPADMHAPHNLVDARDPASDEVILQAAVEGHVLVKNTNNVLPLQKPKFMSIFGYDAVAAARNTPTSGPTSTKWDFGMENTQSVPGLGAFNDTYLSRLFLQNEPWNAPRPAVAYNGTLISGGGSGGITPGFIDAPFDALKRQARIDRTYLAWDFVSQEPQVNGASDVCIVFVNEQASEGWDRPNLADPWSDRLILNIAGQCNNTQVIIHNAGIRLVDRWIDHPNITAVIFAHLPGQETGQALTDVLYGKQSPSGRLPYTVAKSEADYGRLLHPIVPENTTSPWYPQDNFTEGVYIDYKDFMARNVTPRFEFGFGLTYSNFEYADLTTSIASDVRAGLAGHTYNGGETAPQPEGGDPALWMMAATVTCTVKNIGHVSAAEVAQLYLHIPGGPSRVLRGFQKKLLQPGDKELVTFNLTRRDLSSWNVDAQQWMLQDGPYEVFVGKSVLDQQLYGRFKVSS